MDNGGAKPINIVNKNTNLHTLGGARSVHVYMYIRICSEYSNTHAMCLTCICTACVYING